MGLELLTFCSLTEGKEVDDADVAALTTNGNTEPDPALQKRIDAIELPASDPTDTQEEPPATEQEQDTDLMDTGAAIDNFIPTAPDAYILPQPSQPSTDLSTLFSTLSVFLSRESPRHPLEFLLRAFGCKRISWDVVLGDGAYTTNEFDPSITHQIVDRPPLPTTTDEDATNAIGKRMPNRTYVQPQWVWDCVNEGRLLRPDLYAPGATLPPHLSPWVKPSKGEYDPIAPVAAQEREGEAEESLSLDEEVDAQDEDVDGQHTNENGIRESESLDDNSEPEQLNGHSMSTAPLDADNASDASFGGFSDHSDAESDTSARRHQRELEAEASGRAFTSPPPSSKPPATLKGILKKTTETEADIKKRKALAKRRREEEEELERRKMMMGRKKRKLVEKMLYGNKEKDDAAEKLRGKRRRIERG